MGRLLCLGQAGAVRRALVTVGRGGAALSSSSTIARARRRRSSALSMSRRSVLCRKVGKRTKGVKEK